MRLNSIHRSSSLLVLTLLSATASAAPQANGAAQTGQPKTLEERALEREQALGLQRIQVGPNEFEFALPPGLDTPDVVEKDGLISVYEGQSTFDICPTPASPQLIMQRSEAATSPVEDMIGSVRIDEYGRRWRTVDVDRGALMDAIARYDALVESKFGAEPGAVSEDPFQRRAPEQVTEGLAMCKPLSWTLTDCGDGAQKDIMRYGADDRCLAASPMTPIQEKVVLIRMCEMPGGSGVMVDSNTVLTAAHVVCAPDGRPYDPHWFEICTHGNYQSGALLLAATGFTIPGGYTGDGDYGDDYALVHLSSSPSVGWMPISQASNSTIKNADCYNHGYPKYTPSCALNLVFVPGRILSRWGQKQYWSCGELFDTTSKRIKTRIDCGPGHSGGPCYYYPGGCCGSHYVTGVLAGHVGLWIGSDYTGGPKGSAIRSWVIANM